MNSFWAEISAAVLPALVTLFGTVLTIILNQAAKVARERWGVEIEARHREALQSAVMSGLQAALLKGLAGRAAVDAALDHVAVSVPDALVKLAPSRDVLVSIAEAKLRQIAQTGKP